VARKRPSGFAAQHTPSQQGTHLRDVCPVEAATWGGDPETYKGLKASLYPPPRVTHKCLRQLRGVTDISRNPSGWLTPGVRMKTKRWIYLRRRQGLRRKGCCIYGGRYSFGGVQGPLPRGHEGVHLRSLRRAKPARRRSWSSFQKVPAELGGPVLHLRKD